MPDKENKGKVIITATLDGKKSVHAVIPPQGSLGLLALGYRGIVAWREARGKAMEAEKLNNQVNKK